MRTVMCAALMTIATCQFTLAAEVSIAQALDTFERATQRIQSYDLIINTTRRFLAKTEKLGTVQRGRREFPVTEWRALEPGESGTVWQHRYRQVRDAEGRRHVETVDPSTGNIESVVTFDGGVERTFVEKSRHGGICKPNGRYVAEDEDYVACYANAHGESPYVKYFRERKGTRVIEPPEPYEGTVVDSPPEKGTSMAQFGFTVWLDANHGLLPSRIDVRQRLEDGDEIPTRRIVVRKFLALDMTTWVPVEVSCTHFVKSGPIKGSSSQEVVSTVDIVRSSWNVELADTLFTIEFPVGTLVHNELTRTNFVMGDP